MANRRLLMRKIRDILRLKWKLEKSNRETSRSLGVSPSSVTSTVNRARAAEMTWEQAESLTDDELEMRLYGERIPSNKKRSMPDFASLDIKLRKPGVTLEQLHWQYLQEEPEGYRYSRFCQLHREWRGRSEPTMRQVHKAGDKLFIDYSGKKPSYIDRTTGEVHEVELFVAALGASNYTFGEATETQKSRDFVASNVRMLEYIGDVPGALVPDQLKSAVTKSCKYEPQLQRTYAEMARHYDTAVVPARPRKPRDKAKGEAAVKAFQHFVLARLHSEQFFSLAELNERIAELLEAFNDKPMKGYGGKTRRQLFEELDRPALKGLPAQRFVYTEWKSAKVNIDYHVVLDKHFYSVPHNHVRESVELRYTATTVEIFHRGKRIASHVRSYENGRYTTIVEHMPAAHRAHLEWTPTRLINWAGTVGSHVKALVEAILETRRHPEQGYRSCLGILRLEKRYGGSRLDAACRRALAVGARSYKNVESILRNGLDRQPLPGEQPDEREALTHDNIRGPEYYH